MLYKLILLILVFKIKVVYEINFYFLKWVGGIANKGFIILVMCSFINFLNVFFFNFK